MPRGEDVIILAIADTIISRRRASRTGPARFADAEWLVHRRDRLDEQQCGVGRRT
jgi:hypothetical protein